MTTWSGKWTFGAHPGAAAALLYTFGAATNNPSGTLRGRTGVSIEDCRSKNGTKVGEEPVTGATVLRDGDQLRFGTVSALYRASGTGMSTETHGGSGVRPGNAHVRPHEDPSHG